MKPWQFLAGILSPLARKSSSLLFGPIKQIIARILCANAAAHGVKLVEGVATFAPAKWA